MLYYDNYIVVDEGSTPLQRKQLLSEEEYREAIANLGLNLLRQKSVRMGFVIC